ncbi:hypothetical protein FNV43_RR24723 [Rhamnella rubrinervis]|uniref:dolichyl-diphosphooligosaccharide--protein glycotransferase n=1 Tax=Rhamnella rubrinervis TaxID=2594499 RepID=A0A8K0DTM4_9ROSA|nr:hypothetical protein FNV43_RR24723 [Rhamnella rubrinervis]
MDDDSNLEFELEAFPSISREAATEVAACVKVNMVIIMLQLFRDLTVMGTVLSLYTLIHSERQPLHKGLEDHFQCKEVKSASAGLTAAALLAMVPSYISRYVAGSYDNEVVAIFALTFTFYLYIKFALGEATPLLLILFQCMSFYAL